MYYVSSQGVGERAINVHYYYYYKTWYLIIQDTRYRTALMAVKPSLRLISTGFSLRLTNGGLPPGTLVFPFIPGMFGTGSLLPLPRLDR